MNYTIGCDPELIAYENQESRIDADDFLEDDGESELGCDGCSSTVELRPEASRSILGLVSNIKRIFKNRKNFFKNEDTTDVDFKAGHMASNSPIGGHIHFGFNKDVIDDEYSLIAASIDSLYYPFMIISDDIKQRTRRTSHGYGQVCGWKEQPHGLEYRTPYSWLHNPVTAIANIGMAELGFYSYFHLDKSTDKNLLIEILNYDNRNVNRPHKTFNELLPLIGNVIPIPEREEWKVVMDCILWHKENAVDYNQFILNNWINETLADNINTILSQKWEKELSIGVITFAQDMLGRVKLFGSMDLKVLNPNFDDLFFYGKRETGLYLEISSNFDDFQREFIHQEIIKLFGRSAIDFNWGSSRNGIGISKGLREGENLEKIKKFIYALKG